MSIGPWHPSTDTISKLKNGLSANQKPSFKQKPIRSQEKLDELPGQIDEFVLHSLIVRNRKVRNPCYNRCRLRLVDTRVHILRNYDESYPTTQQ